VGARKLLALFAAYPFDADTDIIDKGLMHRLIYRPHDINVYVIGQTDRYFVHDERDLDRVK